MDYDAVSQNIVFFGTTSVIVSANSDPLPEPNQQFQLILSNTATGETLSTATIIIININPPVFGFDTQQVLTFSEGAGSVTVCVVLVSGTISENTVVQIGSGAPADTATGIPQ